MKKLLTLMLLLVFAFCAGCEERVDEATSPSIDVNREPEVLIFDTQKNEPEPSKETGASSQLVLHPNMKGESKADEAMALTENLKEDAELGVSVLSKYSDNRYYHLYLSVKNEGKAVNTLTCIYSIMTRRGRPIQTDQRGKYIAPLETWVFYQRYNKGSSTARWVFKATRRK
ncbi:MAG: hypothetical protein U5N86_07465 [Planctomycetota bacterium]|nr:hypothetical protein [Planctomycetota bacterium]